MKGVDPTKILCLSFSQKSALDLRKKFKKIGVNSSYKAEEDTVRATTFHSFGYSFINDSYYNKRKLDQIFELFLKEEITNDISLFEGFKRYFYKQFNYDSVFTTEDPRGVIRKYKRSTNPERGTDYQTINEIHEVKTWNDLKIADFLILNNIDYRYRYDYDEEYKDGKVLQVDFYLPEYDVYIDDFNVNNKGVPDWLQNFNQKREYLKQLEFVKGLEKDIIILNSSKDDFLTDLKNELKNRNVKFNKMSKEEIIENLEKFLIDSYSIKKRFDDFISAFKEHNYPTEKIFTYEGNSETEDFFLQTVAKYYVFYKDYLEQNNLIDFTDMILQAIPLVEDTDYEYVLVDEYQDMSRSRFNLLKAILDDSKAKLVVVGDDWQSIYGFNGCEVGFFSNFEEDFPNREIIYLDQTYRASNELITAAGIFVDNRELITKELKSDLNLEKPIKLWTYAQKGDEDNMVYDILKEIAEIDDYTLKENANDAVKKEVMILGRYKDHIEDLEEKFMSVDTFGLDLSFNTIHKVKGLESDNVIILDVNNVIGQGKGIPSKVRNEGFQRFVSFQSDKVKQEKEERRVFYVGLTRTKNNVYLCAKRDQLSPFINELSKSYVDKHNYEVREYYSFLYQKSENLEDKTVQKNLSDFKSSESKPNNSKIKRKRKLQKKLSDF